ncbi:MAG: hypothetical protein IPL27_11050 [Lewinellaceae bacterium]|nr:hypothetical protein [Lewinellaceae bacterium]
MLREAFPKWLPLLVVVILLCIARFGYEFVYRDGPRSEMTVDMGTIFPKLHGIYSSPQTAALYSDLKDLMRRYGPDFAVFFGGKTRSGATGGEGWACGFTRTV